MLNSRVTLRSVPMSWSALVSKSARGTKIQSHAVIDGITTIGRGNVIFPFATVGTIPQDLKYQGEPSELVIGNDNQIREFASLKSRHGRRWHDNPGGESQPAHDVLPYRP